jgi:hypothetical protein
VTVREYEREALAFIEANPEIWRLFCRRAGEIIASGKRRYSARAIFHSIRWGLAMELNDHWSPTFARRWLLENPEHPSFFELRGDCTAADVRQLELV